MSTQILLTIIIFIAVAILLIWQPINPILIGAGIPIVLTLLNIISPKAAFAQFSNTTIVFFMSLLVIGGAIFKTGLANYVGEKVIGLVGKNERGIILGTALVGTGLSAFLNDTGTTGCLIPIVGAVGKKSNVSRSKLYMVLCLFASIGGTLTMIGSGGHIMIQGLLQEAGYEGYGFFEYARFGLPLAILSFIWLATFGYKTLPDRDIDESQIPANVKQQPAKMAVTAGVFLFIVFCMATNLLSMHVAAALGAFLVVITGCISVEDAVKQFSTSTLFLVAGVFTLSDAMYSSGAAAYIVDIISSNLGGLPDIAVVAALTLFSIIATNFMMGTSLGALLIPMALMLSDGFGIDARALVMAPAICLSGAFCTPFGTGPNLLVYEIGKFKFTDYTKAGFAYAMIMFAVTVTVIGIFYL